MGEASYPFDSGPGTAVDEARWRGMARHYLPNGVIGLSTRDSADTSLKVTLGSGLTFNMADGGAIVDGLRYEATAGPLSKTASANGNTQPRIDRLALQLNTTNNQIIAVIKQGTPGASPSPPALTFDLTTGVVEVPLARATCPGSASAQNYNTLVDERTFIGMAGVVGSGDPFLWSPLKAGDILYAPDFDTLSLYSGAAYRGIRAEQFAGVPVNSSGVANVNAGVETTYASITVPAFGWPYKISFSAHHHMLGLASGGGYSLGKIRQDVAASGTIVAEGSQPTATTGLDTSLSIPQSAPITISDGLQHVFYFRVTPSHNATFFWNIPTNYFSAIVTPEW
ncbi:hypothetical protein JOF56_011601 [Kibdelosporangium banguiense]|uniref:Phage tail protein n=1 Tax=Kibdelosporangium banguiense TaxID=1365924 RepID=A0ABS4U3K6_9PSEU|nr:hypothetical protein [Kibdelosporangium banguiense]MBP2331216.1 hypothetical protein [Kibdelosporangium banguiense]